MNIESYMRTVISNLNNNRILTDLMYCELDRDCGYRSGLKYLNLQKTIETDDIAHRVIYGGCLKKSVIAPRVGQMDLFA